MKKMKKKLKLFSKKVLNIIIVIAIVLGNFMPMIPTVSAATIDEEAHIVGGDWIPNIWITKERPAGQGRAFQQARFLERAEDGAMVYCLQPGVSLGEQLHTGYSSDQEVYTNMTREKWNQIVLIAYYGYGYNQNGYNHNDVKWNAITQLMIWRVATAGLGWDIYFTDGLDGDKLPNKFLSEIAEIEELVAMHNIVPSIDNSSHRLAIGTSITLTDTNNVLSQYTVSSNSKVNVSVSGDKITLTAKEIGNTTLELVKKDTVLTSPPIAYVHPEQQNVMLRGWYDPIYVNLDIEVYGGKIEINKLDIDTNQNQPQGAATLEGATYDVYNSSDVRVGTIVTDSKGNAISDYLPTLGRFYVLERIASKGYQLDNTKYYFDVTADNLYPKINVYEKVINRDIEITKVSINSSTGTEILTPEPNVKFGFFDLEDNLIAEATTDSNGMLKVNLPYNKYIVRQLTTVPNYEMMKDFRLDVLEMGSTIKYVISNAEVQAKLKVVKTDADTGETITRSGIKFKIYDLDNDRYVKQTLTYPTSIVLDVFETDENGILTTPYPLSSGHYRLEEQEDSNLDGYLWNSEALLFEITDKSVFIEDEVYGALLEVKFQNKEVKGRIEINKKGEEVIIENGTFRYEKIDLANVKFNVYASEDIYSANNKLVHLKDELIGTFTTNELGFGYIDNLYLGNYYILEMETDINHILNTEKIEMSLKYKDQYTEEIILSKTVSNLYKKGELDFTKIDVADGAPIPNTKIEIYTVDGDQLVFSGITDAKGKIKITGLFKSKFYIIETEAETGYRLSDEKTFFEVLENGEIVKAFMTNEKITGLLEFTKIDISTGEPIPNTLMEIYTHYGELIYSGRTDENGMIILELSYGKYYLIERETATPDYILNTEPMWFEITEEGEIVKATMANELKPIDVPNTEVSDYPIYGILGSVFIMAGIGIVTYVKRKKK